MSSQTHTHTHTHTHTRRLIRRLPSYSLCTARTSLPFVYVLLLATFIFLFTPFILALLSPSPSLSLALYLPLSPLAACLPIMELICLAHKECLSISAGLSVPREMVTNHTNMCICSVYIIVFLIVCVCVWREESTLPFGKCSFSSYFGALTLFLLHCSGSLDSKRHFFPIDVHTCTSSNEADAAGSWAAFVPHYFLPLKGN